MAIVAPIRDKNANQIERKIENPSRFTFVLVVVYTSANLYIFIFVCKTNGWGWLSEFV